VAAAGTTGGIAVLPFQNRTGDPRYDWYGENTADLLHVVLAQGGGQVIGKPRLFEVLHELKVEGPRSLEDPTLFSEVARRSGATLLVRGDALRLAGSIILTAEVVDVATGRVIGAERVTGVNEDNMLEKVDELGRLLGPRLEAVR
jgi:TolB-like protein